MAYRTATLIFGAIFCVTAFVLLLVSVCTNWWVYIQVDRIKLGLPDSSAQKLAYLTRNRGIFKECFANRSLANPLIRGNRLADDSNECINTDFSTYSQEVTYSGTNKSRSDLMICQVVFLCLSLVICFCAFGVFCYSLYFDPERQPRKWGLTIKWTGILIFVSAFCNALGMAFFHGAEYLETQKIRANDQEEPYDHYFRLDQPAALRNATTRFYNWSYVLSWLAVALNIVSALLLFLCGACCRPRQSEKQQIYESSTMQSGRSYGHRNRAYEYAEDKLPAVIYTSNPEMNDGMYYDHFKGRHFNPYRGGPIHQEIAPQYNYEDGGWRWQ